MTKNKKAPGIDARIMVVRPTSDEPKTETQESAPGNSQDEPEPNPVEMEAATHTPEAKTEQQPAAIVKQDPPRYSLSEIKQKLDHLHRLNERHNEIRERLQALNEFEATFDPDECDLHFSSNGKSFRSSDPRPILRLVEFTRENLNGECEDVEKKMFAALQ